MSAMGLKDSFPYRAGRYALRLPGRLYSAYITEPIIKRWIKKSELMVYVHDLSLIHISEPTRPY